MPGCLPGSHEYRRLPIVTIGFRYYLGMEVRAGWATKYGETKYDVSTHETDLARILLEAGVSAVFQAKVTAEEAWVILDAEARWLAEHAMARYLRSTGSTDAGNAATARASTGRRDRDEAVRKVRVRLGLAREEVSRGGPGDRAVPQADGGSAGAAQN